MRRAIIIGNFDGVHRGHQAVLGQARAVADARGLPFEVLTFDPHPRALLGGTALPVLTTLDRRIELLRRHGADLVHVEPFTRELAGLSPDAFARGLLQERLDAKVVIVGNNFRYGAQRSGDIDTLRASGAALGFEVIAAEIVADEKGKFSSTRIRAAISAGDLPEAERNLGRRHSIAGVVEGGDRRGRTIGFPTANLGGAAEVLPPFGVYAVSVDLQLDGRPRPGVPGVMNLGVRPTVDGKALRVEVHLFDFDGDLYGSRMRVHLVARLRDEMRFSGIDELKARIAADAAAARGVLGASAPGDGFSASRKTPNQT